VAGLAEHRRLVLRAPPGAGKTTRVPVACVEAARQAGAVWVLEPRRLAARLSAARVSAELGQSLGGLVGYHVRHDEARSKGTQILYLTEGLFLRRVMADPKLNGVGTLILDEFHERHLDSDLALAIGKRLLATRDDFRLVVMSATLDVGNVAKYLGECPQPVSEGRRFEVAIEYLAPAEADRPLEKRVANAVRRLLSEGLEGDVLVFLPGAREIRAAESALSELVPRADFDVVRLHGNLSPSDQNRAVAIGRRRKIILSTNVAETSLTVEGVVAVIDSGLHRQAFHSPWSGLPTLKLQKISRASAEQRAGRAGRLQPGRCIRLYSRHDYDARPDFDAPEIRRADLAETVLRLAALGVENPFHFDWFEAPLEASVESALALGRRLGALDASNRLTEQGRRMLDLGLHPRQARIALAAEARGLGHTGARLAALIGEGDVVRDRSHRGAMSGPSDLLEDLERLEEARNTDPERMRTLGLDPAIVDTIDRAHRQWADRIRPDDPHRRTAAEEQEILLRAVLAGYPDRVAKRRHPDSRELVFCQGGSGQLSQASVVVSNLMLAIDVEERGERGRSGKVLVTRASAISADWLLDLFPDSLAERVEYEWNEHHERVERIRRLVYERVILDEKREIPDVTSDAERVARILRQALRDRGDQILNEERVRSLRNRILFLRAHVPELRVPILGEAELDLALTDFCIGRHRLIELDTNDFIDLLVGRFPPDVRSALTKWAPEKLMLHSGRQVLVDYTPGRPPSIASRLQDFFGRESGPSIASGRVPLTLHLLAPNQRAVQVTSDLAGFWARQYPAVRRELCRKYPKHFWPENPLAAAPPPPLQRRDRRSRG
jgi:ATP-dependent helicase HrpB